MDYEKKYKEMVRRAKELYESGNALTRQQMGIVCPELTESEDERMANMVLKALDAPDAQSCIESWGINPKDVKNWFLAYLEKQKEQKPLKYLDKKKVYAVMTKLNNLSYSQLIPINSDEYKKLNEITSDVRDLLDYPIEQKPAEWSEDFGEEVEKIHKRYPEVSFAKLTRIAYHFSKWANRCKDIEWSEEDERNFYWISTTIQERHLTPAYTQQVHKILSWLKSLRPSWKPSEEQMRELHCALIPGNPFDCDVLNGLYVQLKKLM